MMFEELAIIAYLPVIFLLKHFIDSLSKSTRVKLTKIFELPWVLWCTCLSIFSGFGMYYTGRFILDNFVLGNIYTIHGSDVEFWYHAFMASKVYEFIDTILIILRSKPLVQLQYIHHLFTAIICYVARPILCDFMVWLFFLNYFVHFFMYFYFAMYPFFKSTMKIFGTFINFIQTLQMFIALYIIIYFYNNLNLFNASCILIPTYEYFRKLIIAGLFMYGYYAYLFVKLFFERSERIKRKIE